MPLMEQWFDMAPGENTVNVPMLWQDQLFTKDHRVIQYMLATGFEDFRKGPITKLKSVIINFSASFEPISSYFLSRLFGMFGNGIFNSDGAEWKAHRALTRPFFGGYPANLLLLFWRRPDACLNH